MSEEKGIYQTRIIEAIILTVREQKVIADFMFRLTPQEVTDLRSQFVTSSTQPIDGKRDNVNRSQFVTGSSKHRDPRFQPCVFTEHGAIMAATVLNSPKAVQMSVFVVRAFVRMRQALLSRVEMEKRLEQIEKILLVHDDSLRDLYGKIRPLLLPPPEPPPKPIGFQVKERQASYRVNRKRN
jgi:hypothetical protein